MVYRLKDISVIIATYNRDKDLTITLNSFKDNIKKLNEVIIVDDSDNDESKKVAKKFGVKYVISRKRSLTLSRNLGIKTASKNAKILLFLDDDISLGENYFEGILEVFNKKDAMGVGGYYLPKVEINKIEMLLRKFFFIENLRKNNANVLSAYGAGYPSSLSEIIVAGWIPGFNMAFKKKIFERDKFDENFFKYGLGEDFEFTTRINKKYPNSLFITPYAKIIHRVSPVERLPKPKLGYMNQVNHLYIQKKNFNSFSGISKTAIAIFTITFIHFVNFLRKPNKINKNKLEIHIKSILYCLKRLGNIRRGDLTIPF